MTAIVIGLLTQFWPYIAAAIAALAWGIGQRRAGAKAERNANRAKDADSYEQHLREIANASNARPSKRVSDDPRNRDRH